MARDRLADAWRLSLADAEIAADSVVLVPYEQDPGSDFPKAAFHAPNDLIAGSYAARIGSRAASLMDRQIAKARILCWERMDDRLLLPVLRHELQHVQQWMSGGGAPVMQLAAVIQAALTLAGIHDLPYTGQIYNLSPHELDANNAASRLVRSQIGDVEADRLAADIQLDPGLFRRRPGPEPVATLRTRLICHAAAWPEHVEAILQSLAMPPERFFDRVMPAGAGLWDQLRGDRVLRGLVADAAAALPRRDEILAAVSPQRGWHSYRTRILGAVNRARDLAGLLPTPISETPDTLHPSADAPSISDAPAISSTESEAVSSRRNNALDGRIPRQSRREPASGGHYGCPS